MPANIPLHTVSSPTPSPSWVNITDPVGIFFCTRLIRRSTLFSRVERGARLIPYSMNISAGRATLWLWRDPSSAQRMTVAFHAADGPPYGTGRFNVCAGINAALTSEHLACKLWKDAVIQFASNNPNTQTDNIYLWADATDGEPRRKDRIYKTFCEIINYAGDLTAEDYPNSGEGLTSDNKRWPTAQRTRKFKNPL
jgi:hypothetical protein